MSFVTILLLGNEKSKEGIKFSLSNKSLGVNQLTSES